MNSQHKKPTVFKVDLASMAAIGFFMFYVAAGVYGAIS